MGTAPVLFQKASSYSLLWSSTRKELQVSPAVWTRLCPLSPLTVSALRWQQGQFTLFPPLFSSLFIFWNMVRSQRLKPLWEGFPWLFWAPVLPAATTSDWATLMRYQISTFPSPFPLLCSKAHRKVQVVILEVHTHTPSLHPLPGLWPAACEGLAHSGCVVLQSVKAQW